MDHLFPPLLPRDPLEAPVLVLAAHPDDEVIAAGGMLAFHRRRGDRVRVVHLTDGAAGDPDARFGDIAAIRRTEGAEALRRLGVEELVTEGLPDGELAEHSADVEACIRRHLVELQPKTLYSFFATEAHRDHRVVARSVARVIDAIPAEARILLFGVNQVVVGGTMFDISDSVEQKVHALDAYQSQLAYNDFAAKIRQRDCAATVNIEDPSVRAVEVFADLTPPRLERAVELADSLNRFLLRADA